MSREIAIIGDIHGNLTALKEIITTAMDRTEVFVFCGGLHQSWTSKRRCN